MKKVHKIGKVLGIVLLVLVLLVGVAAIGFKIYTSHYYAMDQDITTVITNEYADRVLVYSNDAGMAFFPKDKNFRAIIVYYPGGKVEYTAYESLMYKLSARGFICLLPKMPENIALLDIKAVDTLVPQDEATRQIADSLDWYMAGHSLGGAAATKYLSDAYIEQISENSKESDADKEKLTRYKGLILCGSYPPYDLTATDLRLLSIYGSNDGVLNMESYEEDKAYWPEDSTEYEIEGGIHSYFGCYGIQEGDGDPSISNEEQLDITVDVIDRWISKK